MNDKDLEKLVFGMAHQIRNPCAIILANANLLIQNPGLKPEARHSLEAIIRGANYLRDRLAEFVEFSKPLRLNIKELPANNFVNNLISMVREKCQLQNIKISCNNIDKSLTIAKADHDQLVLAFLNILLNAMESIKDEGVIYIDAQSVNGMAQFTLRDTGCGIHPRDLPEVFSPFYSTKEGGVGIGLAVTKRIIDAHNGRIEVTSQQGKGTTVTVHLPLI